MDFNPEDHLNIVPYTRKPFRVDAVQVTESDMALIAEWCNGYLTGDTRPFIKVDVKRPMNDRQTRAYVGDWVLKAETGFKVYTNRAFHNTFEVQQNPVAELAEEVRMKGEAILSEVKDEIEEVVDANNG